MKTTIAAIIILSASFQLSYSQFISNVGVKAGVTFSNQEFKRQSGDDFWQWETIHGYNGNIFTEVLSSKNYTTVFEAGYEQRGYGAEIIETNEFGEELDRFVIKEITHYATFGLLAKLKIQSKSLSAYFSAGPKLDVYLGYTESVPSGKKWIEAPNPFLEDFKKINYSLTFGTGIELSFVKRFRPFVEFNYSPPISKSFENSAFYVREHYFNIKAGIYIFDFGKRKK